jgi:hypothetical protein
MILQQFDLRRVAGAFLVSVHSKGDSTWPGEELLHFSLRWTLGRGTDGLPFNDADRGWTGANTVEDITK